MKKHVLSIMLCGFLILAPLCGVAAEPSELFRASIQSGEAEAAELTGAEELGTGFEEFRVAGEFNEELTVRITRAARPIRPIVKQDVYGQPLYEELYHYRNALESQDEVSLYYQMYANALDLDAYFEVTNYRVHESRVTDIYNAMRFDNPDLFWLDVELYYTYDADGCVTSVTMSFFDCVDDLDAYKSVFYGCADSILEEVMYMEYEVDKVKYIHDLLTHLNDYEFGYMNQSAYSALCLGETVCAGYASAFAYLMQRLNIDNFLVRGNAGENHLWNVVFLDGEYYAMDVTWDDPLGNPANTYVYSYFNVTDALMSESRYRFDLSAVQPEATGTYYTYDNIYGHAPGSDFSTLNYGAPSALLPFIYPEHTEYAPTDIGGQDADTYAEAEWQPIIRDDDPASGDDEETDDGDEASDDILDALTEEEWQELWAWLEEALSDEEMAAVEAMTWEEFTALLYEVIESEM